MGEGALAMDAVRWHYSRHQSDPADAGVAAAWGARVLAVGTPEILILPLSVPAVGHLSARAGRGARASAETRSADAGRTVPRSAGGVLPRAQGCRPAAGHGRGS